METFPLLSSEIEDGVGGIKLNLEIGRLFVGSKAVRLNAVLPIGLSSCSDTFTTGSMTLHPPTVNFGFCSS